MNGCAGTSLTGKTTHPGMERNRQNRESNLRLIKQAQFVVQTIAFAKKLSYFFVHLYAIFQTAARQTNTNDLTNVCTRRGDRCLPDDLDFCTLLSGSSESSFVFSPPDYDHVIRSVGGSSTTSSVSYFNSLRWMR